MKALLVYAAPDRRYWPEGSFRSRWVPTGLAYLARSLLRAGHQVKVHVREEQLRKNRFDWDDADSRLRGLLAEFRPDLVGVSALTPMVADTAAVAEWAKDILGPNVLTVAGGAHPSALPERMLADCPALDAVVVGEGEQTLAELAARGLRTDVAGLVYRQGDGCVRTGPRAPCRDLDSLGPPAYELFDMPYYTCPDPNLIHYLPLAATNIRTSRGCPNRCAFCAGHVVSGVGVREHSLDYVLEQVHRAADQFGVEAIHFEDETIGFRRQRLMDLCQRLQQAGLHKRLKWDCCLRVDQADSELLRQMKSAGCIQVEYGFECASDRALGAIGKNADMELNRRAVALTRQAGLRIFADIMFGLPGETEGEFQATVDFLRWARPEIISAGCLYPLPGSAIFNSLPQDVRDTMSWGQYAYFDRPGPKLNLTAMPDHKFERLYRDFVKYTFRPQLTWALLRDSSGRATCGRSAMWTYLAKFALKHPIRAARVPW